MQHMIQNFHPDTDYRTLLSDFSIGPNVLEIQLTTKRVSGGPKTYIVLKTRSGDVLLYLGLEWGDGLVTVSRCTNGSWHDNATLHTPLQTDSATFLFAIANTAVTVRCANETLLQWPISTQFEELFSLDCSGDWSTDRFTFDAIALSPEVLPKLPIENNLLTTAKTDLIFDFGMHNGDDTDFYIKKGFKVIAIEANPALCAVAAKRFDREIGLGKLTICNVGVAPVRGELVFFINHRHSEWSSFDRAIASRGHPVSEIKVSTASPMDFFAAFGVPYYCKIDIEGFDRQVIEAIVKLQVKPEYVSFENGSIRDFELLANAGYTAFQLVEQSVIPEISLSMLSQEGEFKQYIFPNGSSGPFGIDLGGIWSDYDEMQAILKQHHLTASKVTAQEFKWWDLHAALIRPK
jgi:FkbM family methyltransferase